MPLNKEILPNIIVLKMIFLTHKSAQMLDNRATKTWNKLLTSSPYVGFIMEIFQV